MKGPLKLNGLALCGSSTILSFSLETKSACFFLIKDEVCILVYDTIQVENKVLLMVLQKPLAKTPFCILYQLLQLTYYTLQFCTPSVHKPD